MNWDVSLEEDSLILSIVARYEFLMVNKGIEFDKNAMRDYMDIAACHLNGCRLNLDSFLNGEYSDFIHDYLGIKRHINRQTGKMEDSFLPRFADLQKEKVDG